MLGYDLSVDVQPRSNPTRFSMSSIASIHGVIVGSCELIYRGSALLIFLIEPLLVKSPPFLVPWLLLPRGLSRDFSST